MAESSEIRKMEDALKKAETSFHVLFEKMNGDGSARVVCDCNYKDLLEALRILFRKLHGEVSALGAATINPRRTRWTHGTRSHSAATRKHSANVWTTRCSMR